MQEPIGTVIYLHPPFEVESFNFENFQRNTSLLYKSIKKNLWIAMYVHFMSNLNMHVPVNHKNASVRFQLL